MLLWTLIGTEEDSGTPTEHSPVWRPHEGVGRGHDGRRAKVPQFDLTGLRQQDVSRFYVPADVTSDTGEHAALSFPHIKNTDVTLTVAPSHQATTKRMTTRCTENLRVSNVCIDG